MDQRTLPEAGSSAGEKRMETPGPAELSAVQKKATGEKIDLFCHILPKKYNEALLKKSRPCYNHEINRNRPALTDLELRFKTMDKFDGLKQVLTLGAPPIEFANSRQDAVDLARMANDEMAELLNKYPGRFVAAVASLPMSDVDASLREADRAINELNFKGVQIFSSINGKPLDSPMFQGLYEKMAQNDLPILIHPVRDRNVPDYPGEKSAKYTLFLAFGWPFDTTIAVGRLVFSGILEKYQNLILWSCAGFTVISFYGMNS